jgi:uncharacterized SAM-binding protein YcdF (DUF218 family)
MVMGSDNSSTIQPPRSRRRRTIAVCMVGGAVLGCAVFLLSVGRWLVVQDPLEKAQAIVVLSGAMPLRALEASKLYGEGYAPQVWLTCSAEPGATLEAMGIAFTGEESYNQRVLIHEGVPAEAIRVLEPRIVNTADEIAVISGALGKEKDRNVIIVTSKSHTRRVRILWRKLAGNNGRAVIRAASDDPFEPRRWWRTSSDALDVVREVLGIMNAWAGLPLRPAK